MSAIQVAIQLCVDEGWYAELREAAPYWLGYFPVDPPDLQAELSRCATLPKKDDVRLRALLAVWQLPPWGPLSGLAHVERAAQDLKNAWVNQTQSPAPEPTASPVPPPAGPFMEPTPPMQDAALPELGYPHARLALPRFTRLVWRWSRQLSTLHASRRQKAVQRLLMACARKAGLLERTRRGVPKRLPKPEHLRELERQTRWLVSQVNEWSSKAEAFVVETQRLAEEEAKGLAEEAEQIAGETKRRAGERERLAATVRADSAKIDERLAATETAEVRAKLAKMDELGMIALRAEREERIADRSAEWAMVSASRSPAATTPAPTEAPSVALSLDNAWSIRFPMLARDERRALVSRVYPRGARKYSVADWLMAQRLGFNATAIRQERAKGTATDDRPNAFGHRDDS